LLAFIKLCQLKSYGVIDIAGFKLIPIVYNEHNILIGGTLILCHIFITIYALSNKQFNEIIWANIYSAASLFALLTDDFISLFAALELMMIASSSIIFLGGHNNSKTTAMRYVIMHLTAGICILSGVILITNSGVAREIHVLSLGVNENLFSKTNLGSLFILFGLLMNVGAPPFSAWITDSYPHAKTSGTAYLSLYTTKVAAYYLLILFPGWKLLLIFGIIMSLYGALYAILENNIRRIICYLAIFQLGLVLIGIGLGTNESLLAAKLLIFSHIIYNSLLLIIAGVFIDYNNIEKCTDITEITIHIKPLLISGFVGIVTLISFPYSGTFFAKSLLGESIYNYSGVLYAVFLGLSCSIIISIPWKQLIKANYNEQKNINSSAIFALYSLSFLCLFSGIFSLIILRNSSIHHFPTYVIANQLLLNFASVGVIILLYNKEHKTRHLLLTFDYFYRKLPWTKIKEVSIQDNQQIKQLLKDVNYSIGLVINKISYRVLILSQSTIIITLSLIIIIIYLTKSYA
jgi:multicomponent Na+:H+ antiporter subunit D